MHPSAMQRLFPDLPESDWPTFGTVAKDRVYFMTKRAAVPLLPKWTAVAEKVAVIVCVLAEFGVIVTEHVDLSVLSAANVHGLPIVSPGTLEVTDTVLPTPGLDFVPFASSSVTVTVAVVDWPTLTVLLLNVTAVVVCRLLTVSVSESELLL